MPTDALNRTLEPRSPVVTDGGPPLVRVRDLSLRFGGITALDRVSIDIREGAVGALIGPNGAGKTSLFNCVSGLYAASSGEIELSGRRIDRARPHQIARMGLVRTFQEVALVGSLDVLSNVMLGAYADGGLGFLPSVARPWHAARRERRLHDRAWAVVEELGLAAHARRLPGELPIGFLKRVELARALMSRPRLLMLDEPACGLTHEEVMELCALIARLREQHDLSILLVEHNMRLVRALAAYVYVLDSGRIIAHGTLDEVSADEAVITAYLGGSV